MTEMNGDQRLSKLLITIATLLISGSLLNAVVKYLSSPIYQRCRIGNYLWEIALITIGIIILAMMVDPADSNQC